MGEGRNATGCEVCLWNRRGAKSWFEALWQLVQGGCLARERWAFCNQARSLEEGRSFLVEGLSGNNGWLVGERADLMTREMGVGAGGDERRR